MSCTCQIAERWAIHHDVSGWWLQCCGKNRVQRWEAYFINKAQYVGNVPAVAWNFWVGGYQPARKWLKDRKGRALTNADIEHYQKMIVALSQTDQIMREIDPLLT